jgi:hypothetical protein
MDALAEEMVLPACRLVPAVQDGDADQVDAIVSPLSLFQLRALAVVLASLVPAEDPAVGLFTTWKLQESELPLPPVTPEQAAENRRRMVAEMKAFDREHSGRGAA